MYFIRSLNVNQIPLFVAIYFQYANGTLFWAVYNIENRYNIKTILREF